MSQPKKCKKCQQEKALNEFYLNNQGYYTTYCKECNTVVNKEYRDNHRTKFNEARKKAYYEKKKENPTKQDFINKFIKEDEKYCASCDTIKNTNEFWFDKKNNRYCSMCSECRYNKGKKYKNKNKDRINDSRRKLYRKTLDKQLFKGAKARAKRDNLDFNLELSDVVVPTHCPVFNIKLEVGKEDLDTSACIDRIDNNKGYIKGNIIVVSRLANRLKWDSTQEQRERLAEFYKNMLKISDIYCDTQDLSEY